MIIGVFLFLDIKKRYSRLTEDRLRNSLLAHDIYGSFVQILLQIRCKIDKKKGKW